MRERLPVCSVRAGIDGGYGGTPLKRRSISEITRFRFSERGPLLARACVNVCPRNEKLPETKSREQHFVT